MNRRRFVGAAIAVAGLAACSRGRGRAPAGAGAAAVGPAQRVVSISPSTTEALFAIAETTQDPLGKELRAPTAYRGRNDVQMKIFVMERIATWILLSDPSFRAAVRDPFAARSRFYKLPIAIICDALKIAYVTQGRGQYKDVFLFVRNLRKLLNLQIRVGDGLGWRRVRPYLRKLASYWHA